MVKSTATLIPLSPNNRRVTSSPRAHPFGKKKKIHTEQRRARKKSEGKVEREAKAKSQMQQLDIEEGAHQRPEYTR